MSADGGTYSVPSVNHTTQHVIVFATRKRSDVDRWPTEDSAGANLNRLISFRQPTAREGHPCRLEVCTWNESPRCPMSKHPRTIVWRARGLSSIDRYPARHRERDNDGRMQCRSRPSNRGHKHTTDIRSPSWSKPEAEELLVPLSWQCEATKNVPLEPVSSNV